MRSFAQSRVVPEKKCKAQPLVPGMSQYSDDVDMDDVDMDAATSAAQSKKVSQESDDESLASGSEESKHVSR